MTVAENMVQLTIASQLEYIELVANLTDNLTRLAEFDEDSIDWINTAVRESVANAVEHGNQYDPNKSVSVTFTIHSDGLSVAVSDHGEGFDPSDLPDPLDPINLLNPAGRGILLMRSYMDEVDYQRNPEGGMTVKMFKKRPEKEEEVGMESVGDKKRSQDAIGD